jgi:hypothetical protein
MQDCSPNLLVDELHPKAEQEESDHRPADPTLVDAVRRLEAHESTHEDAHLAQARQRLHQLEPPAYERLEKREKWVIWVKSLGYTLRTGLNELKAPAYERLEK